MISSVFCGHGFDPSSQGSSSRAKAKTAKEVWRVQSSAIGPAEDTARRSLTAAGASSGSTDRTQATARVPDALVSNFTLTIDGGNKDLLQNDTPICKHSLQVTTDIAGQNGKRQTQDSVLSMPCAQSDKRRRHAMHEHHLYRARVVG